jgi:hypothetical protein
MGIRRMPIIGRAQPAPTVPGVPELRREAYPRGRGNDEVETQLRSWTFYETIVFSWAHSATISRCRAVGRLGIWMVTLTF